MGGCLVEVKLRVPNAIDPFAEFCSSTSEVFGFSGCLRCFEPLHTKENKRMFLLLRRILLSNLPHIFRDLPMSDSFLT